MEVLGHMIIQRDLGHIQHCTTPTQATHHPFLGCLQNKTCDSFQHMQIVQLVEVVLAVTETALKQPWPKHITGPWGRHVMYLAGWIWRPS